MPPFVPVNHYLWFRKTSKIEPRSYSIIPCNIIQAIIDACFEHSNFFKVKKPAARDAQSRAPPGAEPARVGQENTGLPLVTGTKTTNQRHRRHIGRVSDDRTYPVKRRTPPGRTHGTLRPPCHEGVVLRGTPPISGATCTGSGRREPDRPPAPEIQLRAF